MITIAWDIDDVLNDLMRVWFETRWLPEHEECRLTYGNICENPPHRLLETSLNEYRDSLDAFRLSPAFQELIPIPEVLDWFWQNGDRFYHIALTAVPENAAYASAQWMFRHFGRWIRSFHFIPAEREGQMMLVYDGNKVAFLSRIGSVAVFIEDSEDNLSGTDELKIEPVLIPRPWNSGSGDISSALKTLTDLVR